MQGLTFGRPSLKRPTATPIIRRTRSWRGTMQVRFNDGRADSKEWVYQLLFWAPLRVFGIAFVATSVMYVFLGHDQFMYTVMGYESEMQYEARVNPTDSIQFGSMLEKDKNWRGRLRNLELPLHEPRKFDVLKSDDPR